MNTTLTKSQTKKYGPVTYQDGGDTYRITANVRHDDQCGNGHNSFSITADIYRLAGSRWVEDSFGCQHEKVAKHFPELAPLIKWHQCSADEPMHYIANAVYHAGDKDHWGLRKGEFRQHTSRGKYQAEGVAGVPNWELRLPDGLRESVYAHEKPAAVLLEWQPSGITGEGKARDLDAARSCAIWPEATDEELTAPGLEARLKARLPMLTADFQKAVESLGFTF